jgi:hypothetical protein
LLFNTATALVGTLADNCMLQLEIRNLRQKWRESEFSAKPKSFVTFSVVSSGAVSSDIVRNILSASSPTAEGI